MNNGDMPAFPIHPDVNPSGSAQMGISKREYFAAMAMQGMYANREIVNLFGCGEQMSQEAVKIADALLKELEAKS